MCALRGGRWAKVFIVRAHADVSHEALQYHNINLHWINLFTSKDMYRSARTNRTTDDLQIYVVCIWYTWYNAYECLNGIHTSTSTCTYNTHVWIHYVYCIQHIDRCNTVTLRKFEPLTLYKNQILNRKFKQLVKLKVIQNSKSILIKF